MKKSIFTFILFATAHLGFSQTTYYWVGGTTGTSFTSNSNWNTQPGGSGTTRTTAATTDILIFDGSDVDDDPGIQSGPVNLSFTGTITTGQLIFQNLADVTFARTGTSGTTLVNLQGGSGTDLVVDPTSKFTIGGTGASMGVYLMPGTNGEISGQFVMGPNGNNTTVQNRLVAGTNNALRFLAGSSATTEAGYGYQPFGSPSSSTTPAAAGGVVFEANAHYYHNGGLSPFGTNSSTSLVTFLPGSKFHLRAAPTSASQFFNNRGYGDLFLENNTTLTVDGSPARIDSLVITAGSTWVTDSTGSTPVSGHLVVNGTLMAPAAPGERNNRVVMTGSLPQNISGSGIITLSDFYISNQSNVTLQRSLQVDTLVYIIGTLNRNGNNITGPGTTTVKSPASVSVTGTTTDSSFTVSGITDFTGIEVGMSVTGAGIPANTVVTNTSTSSGTITLSQRMTATSASTPLTVFNGQGVLPIRFGDVSAIINNSQVSVSWKVFTEADIVNYIIEKSVDGARFTEVGALPATGKQQYNFVDPNPAAGNNFYRIKSVSSNNETKYTTIMRVNNSNGKPIFSVYPNPVSNRNVNIQMSYLKKGNYTLSLLNDLGQVTFRNVISFEGGSSNQTLQLPSTVKAGAYRLTLHGSDVVLQQTLLVK